jgi:hypothetical protein
MFERLYVEIFMEFMLRDICLRSCFFNFGWAIIALRLIETLWDYTFNSTLYDGIVTFSLRNIEIFFLKMEF